MNFLLDYFFKITAISPTPAASTAFLKQVCLVVAPKGGVDPAEFHVCTSNSQIAAVTDNVEAQQFLAAGMSKVILLPMNDLDLSSVLEGHENDFYTICISSDFDDADIAATQAQGIFTVSSYANLISGTPDVVTINGTAFAAQAGAATLGTATFRAATSNDLTATSLATQINAHATIGLLVEASAVGAAVTVKAKNTGSAGNLITASYTDNDTNVGGAWTGLGSGKLAGGDGLFLGEFEGVVGISTTDDDKAAEYAATAKWVGFHADSTNKAKNMCFAFGSLLANQLSWKNQQYITMPLADDIDNEGDAVALFDEKISFVIDDDQYGKRLGLFAAGGEAIVAPYITKNLQIDIQSKGLQYISGNQPQYTLTQAALLEDELQKVIDSYIAREWITAGKIDVRLEQDDFVASGYINISKPTAMWRIVGEIRQTL